MDDEIKKKYTVRKEELLKQIESFEKIQKSEEWETLNSLVFSKAVRSIERQILNQATSKEINLNELYRLQGEWVWAKHYADLAIFTEKLKKELDNINQQLK